MKKYICATLLILISSCDYASKSVISKKIKEECESENCEINMSKIVTDDWDYVYIFKINNSLEEINNQLGFQYLYFEDIGTRIIFVKNKTVVYHEDEFPNPEKVKKGELLFDMGESNFIKVSRSKAIFLVRKEEDFFKLKLKI